ncbi:hypothetical protein [Clavibacter michiganensis]|uniref:hypothetical protein n=1 Tax=Clavibacter michiganensis TaxID=28447 RepID=UPI0011B09D43|nr:hypothetical protein [Clavibacter michiganensis]
MDADMTMSTRSFSGASDSQKSRGVSKLGEIVFYVLAALLFGTALVSFALDVESNLWNSTGLISFSVTSLGVALALSIFRRQGDDARRQAADTVKMLDGINASSQSAATHAASTYDIVKEMGNVKDIADVPSSQETEDVGYGADVDDMEDETAVDIVRVEGDGEYRKPAAVPLAVLADLVASWEAPRNARDRWTVGNLVGSYRKMNAGGKLTSAPWIVTFRRSGGERVNYRVAYAGTRGRGPAITEVPTV